jgi:hypothetical protein
VVLKTSAVPVAELYSLDGRVNLSDLPSIDKRGSSA